jgi:hypothetical protein
VVLEGLPRLERDVLVYLSDVFVRPGDPREEYVDRINRGIVDAVALGVPAGFFENVVRGYVPDRPVLPAVVSPVPAPASSSAWASARPRRESLNESAWAQSRQNRRSGGGRERASSVSPEPREPRPWEAWVNGDYHRQRRSSVEEGRARPAPHGYWAAWVPGLTRARSTRR